MVLLGAMKLTWQTTRLHLAPQPTMLLEEQVQYIQQYMCQTLSTLFRFEAVVQ